MCCLSLFIISVLVTPRLTEVINDCILRKKFPDSLKLAPVTLIYKGKGGKYNPANYCPISSLPILSSISENPAQTIVFSL